MYLTYHLAIIISAHTPCLLSPSICRFPQLNLKLVLVYDSWKTQAHTLHDQLSSQELIIVFTLSRIRHTVYIQIP
jgi:hypothetical protein